MNEYAIAFNYNLFQNSEALTEYFLPYNVDTLRELVTNKSLKQLLERSLENEINLDAFIQKYNLSEDNNIRKINIPFTNEDVSLWINEKDNPLEHSLWDYLSDAITIGYAEKNMYDRFDSVNALALATLNSRTYLFHTKIILSLLVYMASDETYNDFTSYSTFEYEENFLPADVEKQLQQFYKDVCDFLISDFKSDFDTEYYMELSYHRNPILSDSVVEICNLIVDLHTNTLGKRQRNKYTKIIEDLLVELFNHFHPLYIERLETLAILRSLGNGKNVYTTHTASTILLCINNENYLNHKKTIVKSIYTTLLHSFHTVVENITMFTQGHITIQELRDFCSSTSSTVVRAPRWVRDCYSTEDGCFALLHTKNGPNYFSFSSAKELSHNYRAKMENLAKTVMIHIFHEPCVIDVYAQSYQYNWSFLHDTSDTRRYTQILQHGTEDPSKYISSYESYKNDISAKRLSSNSVIGVTYGCCERKLLASSTYNSATAIFSRWAPCWRCRPAVFAAQPCDFYAFANLDEYKKDKTIVMRLKKYTIVSTYSLSC